MSRPLDLDFITHAPFSFSQWRLLGVVIFAIGLVVAGFTWASYQEQQAAYDALALRLSKLNQSNRVKTVVPTAELKSAEISPQHMQALKQTIAELTMPWEPLLQAVERASLPDVALLGLDPDIKKQQIVLTGEAKNLSTVLDYVQRLLAQEVLSEVVLQKHSVDEANPNKPVAFTIVAHWRMNAL